LLNPLVKGYLHLAKSRGKGEGGGGNSLFGQPRWRLSKIFPDRKKEKKKEEAGKILMSKQKDSEA